MPRLRPETQDALMEMMGRLHDVAANAQDRKGLAHLGELPVVAGSLKKRVHIYVSGNVDPDSMARFEQGNNCIILHMLAFAGRKHFEDAVPAIVEHEAMHAIDLFANPLTVFGDSRYVAANKALEHYFYKGGYCRKRYPHLTIERRAVRLAKDAQKVWAVQFILREHAIQTKHEAFGLLTYVFGGMLLSEMTFLQQGAKTDAARARGWSDYYNSESELRARIVEAALEVLRSIDRSGWGRELKKGDASYRERVIAKIPYLIFLEHTGVWADQEPHILPASLDYFRREVVKTVLRELYRTEARRAEPPRRAAPSP